VTNPELIALVIAGVRCGLRLMDALTQRIVLRGQIRLIQTTAAAAAAVELTDTTRYGRTWRIVVDHRPGQGRS
jgi:hypothetical protein